MMRIQILIVTILFVIGLAGCNNRSEPNSEIVKKINDMNCFISLFEIPATDISRAINFYQAILGISIEQMEILGMEMGIFPYEDQMVTGVIVRGEGYKPTSDGVTIYLNGGDNLLTILNKVEINGGKVIVPKTAHADDSGFFALFIDTEGNKIGLNSPE